MKSTKRILFLLGMVAFLLLSGCSTPMIVSMESHEGHFSKQPDEDKGLVYFYREKAFVGSLRGIYVTANGERIGALNSGTYFVYQASAGENIFSVEDWLDDEDPTRTINVEPGKKYYLKGDLQMGFWDAVPHIVIVHEAEGSEAIKNLKYSTLNTESK